MGIDISGGMIIGANAEEVIGALGWEEDCDFLGDIEEFGWDAYSYYYDAGLEGQVVGFRVEDVSVLNLEKFNSWVEDVKYKAEVFYRITGIVPKLIGMQHVY